MLGFDHRHGWAHLYRSVLEGIALTMTDRLAAMCTELEHPLTRVVLSGGGSAGSTTMQIFADAMDLPTVRPVASSAAGLGAAVCAAVGVGAFPDFDRAAAAMVRLGDVFTPQPAATALYRELLDIHRSIPRHTDPVLARTYPLFH
jgi:sugar (pentulose or hexulose) kinase